MDLANCRYFHFCCCTKLGPPDGSESRRRRKSVNRKNGFLCKSIRATSSTFNIKSIKANVENASRLCLWNQITFFSFSFCIQIALNENLCWWRDRFFNGRKVALLMSIISLWYWPWNYLKCDTKTRSFQRFLDKLWTVGNKRFRARDKCLHAAKVIDSLRW